MIVGPPAVPELQVAELWRCVKAPGCAAWPRQPALPSCPLAQSGPGFKHQLSGVTLGTGLPLLWPWFLHLQNGHEAMSLLQGCNELN